MKKNSRGKGNVIFNDLQAICRVVEWLRGKGWVNIGSTKKKPDEESLENCLRPYSNVGKLGSFFAPLLGNEGLNIAEIHHGRPNRIRLLNNI